MEVGREHKLVKLTGDARTDNVKLREPWQKIRDLCFHRFSPRSGLGRKGPCTGHWPLMCIGGQAAHSMSGRRCG